MNNYTPPVSPERSPRSIFAVIIIFCIPIGIFILAFKACTSHSEPVFQKPDKMEALIKSETFVEKQLKAPSTAEFGTDADRLVTQTNDSTFEVANTVDSQNSFGAMLRQYYTCTIIFTGDKVQCQNLQFSE